MAKASVGVTKWKVRIGGAFTLLRDGKPLKLRTRQQELLLARLVVHSPHPVDRAETAVLLWSEASRTNALAYLRRAVMELREVGIEIDASRDALSLKRGTVEPEFLSPHAEPRAVLLGIDHPLADEVRRIVAERLRRLSAPTSEPARNSEGTESWLVDAILRERPELILDLIAREGAAIVARRPPAEVLDLCEKALATSKEPSPACGAVHLIAAQASLLLTRYGLAERHFVASLDSARHYEDESLATRALTAHAFLLMEIRRWKPALERARRAVESAGRLGDPDPAALAHNNLAGILWHILEFDEAIVHYRFSERLAVAERFRLSARANLVYLWAVFNVPEEPPEKPDFSRVSSVGSEGVVKAYLLFAWHLGHRRRREAAASVATLLDLVASEGQERLLCVALDCAAFAFSLAGRGAESVAVVRLGGRLRRTLGHGRSAAEALAIRRHVAGPFFASEATKLLGSLDYEDPARVAQCVASWLRIVAFSG